MARRTFDVWQRAALAMAMSVACAACGETDVPQAPVSDAAATAEGTGADVPDPRAVAEAALTSGFDDLYEAWLAELVASEALRFVLLDEEPPMRVRRQAFLAALYDARDWRPVFVDADGLSVRGEVVRDVVFAAGEHALYPSTYLDDEALERIETWEEVAWVYAHRPRLTPSEDELAALIALLDRADVVASDDPVRAVFDAAMAPEAGDDPVPGLRAAHIERLRLERARRGAAALAEAALADGMLAYAYDQGHFNVSMLPEDHTEADEHEVIAERMSGTFEAMAAASDEAGARAVLDGVAPHHAQYDLLVAERARYAAIVAAGGWEHVEPRSLSPGHVHPRVAELKQRLAVEGYYDGPIDETFDDALEEAVSWYQTTHQMEVTGESNRGFWNSLNVPAEDRLAQIELTMQRWRESRIGDDPYYILVNVPDFHAEVWRDGERQTRFKVVVGNTDRVCDPTTGQWRYANATPLQTAEMTYVVLNPYWNIPRRILSEELIPELMEDETYFEEQGIERITTESGYEVVRQMPGPNNPLGRVKFMFPNPHNTYLHDTSRPQYFRYPIRAFSHGCMRVETPQEFLELLLRNDGQWDADRIERIYEEAEEVAISLRESVPVHVEYYVVRVDDDGRANFLADIYRYDRDRLTPPDPDDLSCEPEPEPEFDVVLGEDMRPMFRDAEGNLIDPNAPEVPALPGDPMAPGAVGEGTDADPTAGDYGP